MKSLLTPLLLSSLLLPSSASAMTKTANYQDFTAWYLEQSEEVTLPYVSAAIIESDDFTPLHYHGEQRVMPTASLTKLLTAAALQIYPQDWSAPLSFTVGDNETHLRPWVNPDDFIPIIRLEDGDTLTREQAFGGLLVASANNTAYALARTSAYSMDEFVSLMNAIAGDWGMTRSHFVEPSGLSLDNLSTAQDMALGGCQAFQLDMIREYAGRSYVKFTTAAGEEKILSHTLYGLRHDLDFEIYLAAKTGYLDETGYHVSALVKTPQGKTVCASILGADSRMRLDEVIGEMREWVDLMYTESNQ